MTIPPLGDLHDLERDNLRREAVDPVIVSAARGTFALPHTAGVALWLAQLAAWSTEGSRGPLVEDAIRAQRDSPTGSVREKIRAFQILSRIADLGPLRKAAAGVIEGLNSSDEAWEFKLTVAPRLNIALPAIEDLVHILPNDTRRLQALILMRQRSGPVPQQLLRACLETFADPTLRAAACDEVLGQVAYGTLDGTTAASALDLVPEVTDGNIVDRLIGTVAGTNDEGTRRQAFLSLLDWYSRDVGWERRATGMLQGLSTSFTTEEKTELAHRGLAALASVHDDAARAILLRQHSWSLSPFVEWARDEALAIADSIGDQRLRALAYRAVASLDETQNRALEHGLRLTDGWARASLLVEWELWNRTPSGWDEAQWRSLRLETAHSVIEPVPRARYLTILAKEHSGTERQGLALEAHEAARSIADPVRRARALYILVAEGLIPRFEQGAVFASCEEIPSLTQKVQAFAKASRLMTASEFAKLMTRLLDEIIEHADRVDFYALCRPPGLDFGFTELAWEDWHEMESMKGRGLS